MQSIAELKAREEELEREWLWLVEAVNTVARARAEQGERGRVPADAAPSRARGTAARRASAADGSALQTRPLGVVRAAVRQCRSPVASRAGMHRAEGFGKGNCWTGQSHLCEPV